jgi:hypothetical protein
VASQAQIGNLQAGVNAEIVVQSMKNLKSLASNEGEKEDPAGQKKAAAAAEMAPKIFSQSVEFVALPGRTEKLCREIPLAMRQASGESKNYAGCMVLISEEEARLVTVITLWNGKEHLKACTESLDRLKGLLEPHVDSWMRTRKFISLVSIP